MASKDLHLNLKGEYFHAIRAGKKVEEYRLYNDYWRKRLEGREYERLIIKLGYPASHEAHRIINLPYFGYEVKLSHIRCSALILLRYSQLNVMLIGC